VNEIDNVYLYDIDGLQGVVDANLDERRQAAHKARRLIEAEVGVFERWRQAQEITPAVVSLREALLGVGQRELERFRRRLGPLPADQVRAVEELTRAVIHKILHRPIVRLRDSVERGDVEACTELYREIFGLDLPGRRGGPVAGRTAPESESAASESEPPPDDAGPRGPRRLLRGGKD
jgi:glutamyl-tRNA reductase